MQKVQRSSDVIEIHAEHAIEYGLGGLTALFIGGMLVYHQTMFIVLGYILAIFGASALIFAAYCGYQIRNVASYTIECPSCRAVNRLTGPPDTDFTCSGCHRLIPTQDGRVLPVEQVRCGYCNTLNYYSEKTQHLLCESCNREIPLATSQASAGVSPFATVDDNKFYDLILVSTGPHTEDLTQCLQHMLALNRNQVKQMFSELPVTLLTGITRKKAEMLKAQIATHDGAADFRESSAS